MTSPSSEMCFQCRVNIGEARADLGRVARHLADNDVPRLRSRLRLAKAALERQQAFAATCRRCPSAVRAQEVRRAAARGGRKALRRAGERVE